VSILKKPKPQPWRRPDRRDRTRNQNCLDASSNSTCEKNPDNDEDSGCDTDYESESESECEIIFERNVSFDDPLATDMVTGDPVKPSPLSRLEWTALRARECIEQERIKFEKEKDEAQRAWRGFEGVGLSEGNSLENNLQGSWDSEAFDADDDYVEDDEEEKEEDEERNEEEDEDEDIRPRTGSTYGPMLTDENMCQEKREEGDLGSGEDSILRQTADINREDPVLDVLEKVVSLTVQQQL
jgi:hypothetical protein